MEKYQRNKVEFNHFEIKGKYEDRSLYGLCQQIEVEFEMKDSNELIIEFFKGTNEKLSLTFMKDRNEIILNRRDSDYPIVSLGTKNDYLRSQTIDLLKPISLNIFLDVSSIEIFVNNGKHVFTSLFFSKELGERVLFYSEGTTLVHRLLKWEIV
ncbi:GH32 C-terminal domain-containing protein [Neobacillus cucumis]|uniref:GH32 C-terminal domain-containing protein n=1 Tax=Neobacillus cucumis TaxID=1740721 RepID=UPI00285353BD|nr:GH32 C-terminal domain-containing protein [Neobacillus cucumis]MDR4945172.1 GH32 C-terminal domain-containing protein [Neobacillus cucumis]